MDAIIKQKNIGNHRQQTATHSPTSHKCFCVRRKLQTIREITFAMRGNYKPFGKWLSPCAEITNHSGNDSRHARKHQTIREITFAKRGNIKPFGKRISPCAGTPNHSGNDFRHARERQTFCGMICGSPASYINKKSTLKKWIFKVLYKRRRLPTLPHCIAVPSTLATWPLLHHHQCFIFQTPFPTIRKQDKLSAVKQLDKNKNNVSQR